jgi:hypothetical protein
MYQSFTEDSAFIATYYGTMVMHDPAPICVLEYDIPHPELAGLPKATVSGEPNEEFRWVSRCYYEGPVK